MSDPPHEHAGSSISPGEAPASAVTEREIQLQLALEAAGLGTFRIDVPASMVHYSPELAAMLGFPGVTTTRIADALLRVHRDDQDRVRSLYETALDPAGGGRLTMELRFVRPGGEVRWMTWNGRVDFRDGPAGREPWRVLGACADSTERKEAEERLRESEERFRALVELSSDWYWEQDEQFRFTAFSAHVSALAGSSPESHIGKTRWELPVVGVSDGAWSAHRAVLERHEPFRNFEYRRVNENGETIWMSVNGDPVFDSRGRFKGYRGTGHNITDRKSAEAQLKESEARFRLLADSAPVLIWVTGLEGAEFFNKTYREFLGVADEAQLKGLGWARYVHPEDLDGYVDAFKACLSMQQQFEAQFRFLRADGHYRWMKSIGLPRFAFDGACLGYVGSTLDITDLKDNEVRIAHLARELDHRVKNILSRFEVVVDRTADAPLSNEEFVRALKERIDSMARAHSLLSRTRWTGAPIDELIADQLEAYATSTNVRLEGPQLMLSADAAQALSMVVNELATNAAKYGALSVPEGRVTVQWQRTASTQGDVLGLVWQEQGGPTVTPPPREGYGTSVIRDLLAHEFGASVDLAYEPPGLRCTVSLPSARIEAAP